MKRDYLGGSDLAIWQSVRPLIAKLTVESDKRDKIVKLEGTVKNTTGESIYVFKEDAPIVRIWPGGEVWFMSLMPMMVPWSRPIAPHIPPVHRLRVEETMELTAKYDIPLRETHPYPAAPVARIPIPTELGMSNEITIVFGYFLERDGNRLFDGVNLGEKVPGYYDLKRQFLIAAEPIQIHVPILQPV